VFIDGEPRWQRVEAQPHRLEDGGLSWDGIQIDTTDQRRMEEALRASEARLREEEREAQERRLEQERLEAALQKEHELNDLRGRMMVRVSHEFRTPLSVILSSIDIVERYAERITPQIRQERLDKARQQVKLIVRMLDDISLVMRGQIRQLTMEMSFFDFDALCHEAAADVLTTMGSGHRVIINAQQGIGLRGDRQMLSLVISNLLGNAIKFSPAGSTVQLDAVLTNDQVVLTVCDEGIGIPEADQARIFEPFYRGSNIGETAGVGLGLSIVHEVVNLHRGSIEINSADAEGAQVCVRLPLRQSKVGCRFS
jgi:signal transduction histidine kinase